jgi:L-rhamnose mutarotase
MVHAGEAMIRKAFLMTLKAGCRDEYERRHRAVFPKLLDALKKHGAHNYSIFFDTDTDRLFAYAEIESEELWQQIAETESCRRWWAHMKDLMFTNPDDSPVTSDLVEVFHLD